MFNPIFSAAAMRALLAALFFRQMLRLVSRICGKGG
jgi:hypothetical protein